MPDFKAPQVVPVKSDNNSDATSAVVNKADPATASDTQSVTQASDTPQRISAGAANNNRQGSSADDNLAATTDSDTHDDMGWDLPPEPFNPAQQIGPPANPPAQNPNSNTGFGGGWGAPMGGNGWGDPWGGGDGSQSSAPKRLTPQERVEMIERVYQQVLNRKPDTRDINYYKYSTLGEEEIRKQLMEGKEHKQLMEDGRNYKKVEERADQAESRIRMLEGQIKDQIEEFKHLTELLEEKNKFIQRLRGEKDVQYGFKSPGVISPSSPAYNGMSSIPSAPAQAAVNPHYPPQQPVEVAPEPPMYQEPGVATDPEQNVQTEYIDVRTQQQFYAPGSVESPNTGFEAVEERQGQIPITAEDSDSENALNEAALRLADSNPPDNSVKKFLDKVVSIVSPDQ